MYFREMLVRVCLTDLGRKSTNASGEKRTTSRLTARSAFHICREQADWCRENSILLPGPQVSDQRSTYVVAGNRTAR